MATRKVIPLAQEPKAISLYQKHEKVYPRSVQGWFNGWRWAFVWLTQLLFYGLPWLTWNGRQMVLFDLAAKRFYLGPLLLYPQDFIYLTGLLVLSAYGLFLFTAVAGRLWCGYACPQTVYSEIYLWVERRIEGERGARLKLDAARWSLGKLGRKTAKQAVWIAIGLWTGFSFVGYFTPIRTLGTEMLSLAGVAAGPGPGPWEAFWVLFYGFATYGNAGYLREQVCKTMCPYARFQGAMFDPDTLIIGYDTSRGEPRGKRGRDADFKAAGFGSCIDCSLCVQVCPTGIDIRHGLQYECIGCAACIDACDGVMDKMRYPRGLIRYATQRGLAGGGASQGLLALALRPRVLVYGAVWIAIGAALAGALSMRAPLRVDVVRDRGVLARVVGEGWVENVYRLQLMNTTETAQRYRVRAQGLAGAVLRPEDAVELAAAEARWIAVAVQVPDTTARTLGTGAHPMAFQVERLPAAGEQAGIVVHESSTFVVPR